MVGAGRPPRETLAFTEYKEFTLGQWRDHFARIYKHKNEIRSPEQTWSRMLEEIAELIPAARLLKFKTLEEAMPDVFAWLIAFSDIQGISLEDAVWDRFGEGCPWCGATRDCICIHYPDMAPVRPVQKPKPAPIFAATCRLKDWIKGFKELYGRANQKLTLLDITLHLVESAGAVAKALRQRQSAEEIEKKVSHVFAWLIGLYNRYRSMVKDCPDFSIMIAKKYAHCPKCDSKPCKCIPPISSVLVGMVPEDSYGEEEIVMDLMRGEHLSLEFAHNIPENSSERRYVTLLKLAQKAHAVILLLNHTITHPLIGIFWLSQYTGKPAAVFAREAVERDQLLSQFLTEIVPINKLKEFRDNGQLKRDLKAWLRQFPRARV